MPAISTSLKKWMFSRCGCGPSDCQNRLVEGARSCGTAQPGFAVETVHDARPEMSLKCGGSGGGPVIGGSGSDGPVEGGGIC